jgi:hypothetical protein
LNGCCNENESSASSRRIIFERRAPHAAEIMRGIRAAALISVNKTSTAKRTPAIGELKAAAIPAAAPHASKMVRSL